MAEGQNPLLTALPPETDYISYLTIVEHYLSEENLPVLHGVLQDETLTTNIGWDLVHLLTPMLPASANCLQDIARLGNPREVILKVTEALQLLDFDRLDAGAEEAPISFDQFATLLSMLTVLHARIKTKSPSRFLSTTLQAVLASFSHATGSKEAMVVAIVQMVKKMRGIQRPALPARKSSTMLSRTTSASTEGTIPAKDPEASSVTLEDPEEKAIQSKLFQSFLTHVLEEYIIALPSYEGVPGLAWSTRIMETLHRERVVPHRETISSRFQHDELLYARNDTVGQLVSLAQDLRISDGVLLKTVFAADDVPANTSIDEEEPPASSTDIPLSRIGSALLYTARQASSVLHGRKQHDTDFVIFPDHQKLLTACLNEASAAMGTIGTEPEPLIDACLALGLLALENDNIGTPDDTQFNEYLQVTSLLASNCPNPDLRGHAHYLVSTVLRSHPDEKVRYAFIRDTLEHCPFENLKTTAVGWLKGEVIEANMSKDDESSAFSKPITLESLAAFLFPSLQTDLITASVESASSTLQTNLSFYVAVLNFLYLLVSVKLLRQKLDIQDLWKDHDIAGSFLHPLELAGQRLSKSIDDGEIEAEEGKELRAELNVLAAVLERVTDAAKTLE